MPAVSSETICDIRNALSQNVIDLPYLYHPALQEYTPRWLKKAMHTTLCKVADLCYYFCNEQSRMACLLALALHMCVCMCVIGMCVCV